MQIVDKLLSIYIIFFNTIKNLNFIDIQNEFIQAELSNAGFLLNFISKVEHKIPETISKSDTLTKLISNFNTL